MNSCCILAVGACLVTLSGGDGRTARQKRKQWRRPDCRRAIKDGGWIGGRSLVSNRLAAEEVDVVDDDSSCAFCCYVDSDDGRGGGRASQLRELSSVAAGERCVRMGWSVPTADGTDGVDIVSSMEIEADEVLAHIAASLELAAAGSADDGEEGSVGDAIADSPAEDLGVELGGKRSEHEKCKEREQLRGNAADGNQGSWENRRGHL